MVDLLLLLTSGILGFMILLGFGFWVDASAGLLGGSDDWGLLVMVMPLWLVAFVWCILVVCWLGIWVWWF